MLHENLFSSILKCMWGIQGHKQLIVVRVHVIHAAGIGYAYQGMVGTVSEVATGRTPFVEHILPVTPWRAKRRTCDSSST